MLDQVKEAAKRVIPPSTQMIDRRMERLAEDNRMLRQTISQLVEAVSSQNERISLMEREIVTMRADALRHWNAPGDVGRGEPNLVVSFASYGARIRDVVPMVKTLGEQTVKFDRAFIWLPERDFPQGADDVPSDVLCALRDSRVELRWVREDLGPHNKYFWVMREFPESVVVTFDDDVLYAPDVLERLVAAHEQWPEAIVARRAHRISFSEDGSPAPYEQWDQGQRCVLDVPSFELVAIGAGGILYPPGCLDRRVFDISAIKETCLYADDLWLKIMSALAETPVVCLSGDDALDIAEGTQAVALWKKNINLGRNDRQLEQILRYVAEFYPVEKLLERLRGEVR